MPSLPLVAVALLLVAAGITLRFWELEFPPRLTWDEPHFVLNARNYLNGTADWNDHPPLGKLLMALSMHYLGDTSFAFRLPSACMGVLGVLMAGLLSRAVFQNNTAGLVAAAFVAGDGFFIAYSRTALLDGMLAALTLLALWTMTLRGVLAILISGCVIGSAMAVKMSAITLLAPFVALALLRASQLSKRGRQLIGDIDLFGRRNAVPPLQVATYVPAIGLAFIIYLWWWTVGLGMAGQENTARDAIDATNKMMEHHAKLAGWSHPLSSRWWTWALPTTPIMLRYQRVEGGLLRVMTSMGNPLIWWSVAACTLLTLVQSLRSLAQRRFAPMLGRAWLLLAFLAYIAPWVVTNRDSYIYHYLPAYAVGVVLLSGIVANFGVSAKRRAAVLGGVCAVALVSAFYAPVWAQLPLSAKALACRPLISYYR